MSKRQLYIQDPATGRIRFTKAGRERYAARFAKVGYRIDDIRTLAAFEAAVDTLFQSEMYRMADGFRGEDAEFDAALSGLPGWEDS